ncbi:MAG: DUF1559 domain-containing protein [Planctomycetota bacterium]|nr:DUF1559 domain-containing protein [Planctomycetota bacterium]
MKTERDRLRNSRAEASQRAGAGLSEILLTMGILVVLMAVVGTGFLRPTQMHTPAPRRSHCRNNLKQIGLALHNYHSDYGSFPPAFTVDANGQPLHSWRTLILPYLDQQALYKFIDLSKPWNDPANATALREILTAYACQSTTMKDEYTTYQALVGPECAFSVAPKQFRNFKDGTSNTVMVVETPSEMAVHWMDPRDPATPFFLKANPKPAGPHTGGGHVLLADGTVRFLIENTSSETRKALSTIAGGETVGEF